MALSNTLAAHILLMILLFFFLTSVISCNTDNAPCPPTIPGGSPMLPGIPLQPVTPTLPVPTPSLPITPVLPETPPYLPGTPAFLPGTPTYLPGTPVAYLPFPPILPTTPTPYLPVTPTLPDSPTLPTTPIPKDTKTCPKDVLKLGVCTDMLGRSVGQTVGSPPTTPCCKILEGLLDFEAAVCLCTAIKANVLGVVFDFPIAINNVFNHCEKDHPSGFQCE